MRVVETLTLLLVATVLFMWVIFAHPTPDERARLHDSMGASTGIAWIARMEALQRAPIVGSDGRRNHRIPYAGGDGGKLTSSGCVPKRPDSFARRG